LNLLSYAKGVFENFAIRCHWCWWLKAKGRRNSDTRYCQFFRRERMGVAVAIQKMEKKGPAAAPGSGSPGRQCTAERRD